MAREHPAFVDGYILRRRLQEESWEEKKYLPTRCPLEKQISGSVGAWTGSRNSAAHIQSQLAKKSQGQPPHPTSKRQYVGQQSIPSKQSPREPLLEKRYRFSSVPTATSIKGSEKHTTSTGRNVVRKQTTTSQSRSPSSTRRGFRKIRKGYPSKLSYSQGPTRKKMGLADQSSTSASATAKSAHLSSNVTLPHVQKSRTFHTTEERKRRHKQYSSLSINENATGTHHCTGSSPCACVLHSEKECDDYGRHKRSASVDGTVGVAKLWGCVGIKGWRGGECCCEDVGEELGTSLMGDTLSIEDATDESLLEGGSEEEGDDGENGFSEQDLTDLEDEASKCSPVDDSPTLEMPFETGMDPITYTLLVKASQQLRQLSLYGTEESGVDDGDRSSASTEPDLRPKQTKHDQTKPKQQEQEKPKGTIDDQCEYQLTSTINGLCHKEEELELPTIFLTDLQSSSIKDTEQVMKPVGPLKNSSLPSPPLTPSLFPGLQPTIHFPMPDEPFTLLPPSQRSLLKWKMSTITPNVIKHCIARAGFTHCNKGNGWLGYWGKHMRTQAFRAIGEHQKVNHFPGSFEIGRKDRLWRNLNRLQSRVGKNHLNFVPLTFVLPHDLRLLKREWGSGDHTKQKWILKPPAAARGIGVRVIHKWNQIPKKRPIIVQKYIADPFLINGNKFDLRVYVYVSSYDPLKIYVFQDGLARFATCKYSSSMRSLSNRYMHITNYSVNKKNVKFTQNPDETQCQGHKWGLLALWQYMSTELGLNTDTIWDSIKDLVIKTIICSESHCSSLIKAYLQNSYSCHELFGFDVMLDRKLKPWILEVNISPSLHSNSQLDINIKGQMVRDLLNIAGFKLPHTTDPPHHTTCDTLTAEERLKHSHFLQRSLPEIERRKILEKLTAEDVAVLMQAEDEFSRRGMFERVFPSPHSSRYRKFFETEKYYNILLEQWLLKYHKSPSRGINVLQRLSKIRSCCNS